MGNTNGYSKCHSVGAVEPRLGAPTSPRRNRAERTQLLVDTATSTYEAGPRRDAERGTVAHSTVLGPPTWERAADAGETAWSALGIVRVPDASTVRRVFARLHAEALNRALGAWTGTTNIAQALRHHARRPERPLATIMNLSCCQQLRRRPDPAHPTP